jgi:hypothetical protein
MAAPEGKCFHTMAKNGQAIHWGWFDVVHGGHWVIHLPNQGSVHGQLMVSWWSALCFVCIGAVNQILESSWPKTMTGQSNGTPRRSRSKHFGSGCEWCKYLDLKNTVVILQNDTSAEHLQLWTNCACCITTLTGHWSVQWQWDDHPSALCFMQLSGLIFCDFAGVNGFPTKGWIYCNHH